MSIVDKLKKKMDELEVIPKRALGQNFLVAESAIKKIIDEVKFINPKSIIEVGPGLGSLTDELLELPQPLTLVELDSKFAGYWRDRSVSVHEADALKIDWQELVAGEGTALVSNLPYQISSRICIDRCLGPIEVSYMVLMFQKEVAQRILARPGAKDYGFLTVILQSFWDIEFLLEAGPNDFLPAPKIASRVLVFRRKQDFVANPSAFISMVKVAFNQRRKLLVKNLMAQFDKSALHKAFESCGIDPKVRAEELTPTQFQELFAKLQGLGR